MNFHGLSAYRFSTAAQWKTCLAGGAENVDGAGLRPIAPFSHEPTRYDSDGAHAPVATRDGETLWRDDDGRLHRLWSGDDSAVESGAPAAFGQAARIVATSDSLWVIAPGRRSLHRHETHSLARVVTADLAGDRIVDIAADGRRAVFALVQRAGAFEAARVDRSGRVGKPIQLEGLSAARAFTYLSRSKRFVVLGGAHEARLYWFTASGAAITSLSIGSLHPCFAADALGSDSLARIAVAGRDGAAFGGTPYVVILDEDGTVAGDVPVDRRDAPFTGVTIAKSALYLTGPRGMLRFGAAASVPARAGSVSFQLLTPVLFSPDREDQRRWLRVEADAAVPEGCTLEIRTASTDSDQVRDRLTAIASDRNATVTQRIRTLLGEPGIWGAPTAFAGTPAAAVPGAPPRSARLFDIRDRYVMLAITLTASPGAALPSLAQLSVLYPGRTLMEHLPSIYQREEDRPGSFLRSLVGVLEATTQSIDARTATLGRHVHPDTASPPWLDFIARWLGVPWDDSLTTAQKRCILVHAHEIAKGRGTRAGLETLLRCLLPGAPPRFRVTDLTADHGFATVGGGCCEGSTLPAILGGHTRWRAELDASAVVGLTRLPCPNQLEDGVWQLAGRVRVEIAATAEERRAWEPWLAPLVDSMLPLTARARVVWIAPDALRSDRLDGSMTLEAPPLAHLGTNAITNLARLPERGLRLSEAGPGMTRRLR